MTDHWGSGPAPPESQARSEAAAAAAVLRSIQDRSAAIVGVMAPPGSILTLSTPTTARFAAAVPAEDAPYVDLRADLPVLDLSAGPLAHRAVPPLLLALTDPWPDDSGPPDPPAAMPAPGDRVNGTIWVSPLINAPPPVSHIGDHVNGNSNGHLDSHAAPIVFPITATTAPRTSRSAKNSSVTNLDLDVSGLWTTSRKHAPTLAEFSAPLRNPTVAVDPRRFQPQHSVTGEPRRSARPLTYVYSLVIVMCAVIACVAGVLVTRNDSKTGPGRTPPTSVATPPKISFSQGQGGGATSSDSTAGK